MESSANTDVFLLSMLPPIEDMPDETSSVGLATQMSEERSERSGLVEERTPSGSRTLSKVKPTIEDGPGEAAVTSAEHFIFPSCQQNGVSTPIGTSQFEQNTPTSDGTVVSSARRFSAGHAHAGELLGVVEALLVAHEVKIALQLVQSLMSSSLSRSKLSTSQVELQKEFKKFRESWVNSTHSDGALRVLDAAASPKLSRQNAGLDLPQRGSMREGSGANTTHSDGALRVLDSPASPKLSRQNAGIDVPRRRSMRALSASAAKYEGKSAMVESGMPILSPSAAKYEGRGKHGGVQADAPPTPLGMWSSEKRQLSPSESPISRANSPPKARGSTSPSRRHMRLPGYCERNLRPDSVGHALLSIDVDGLECDSDSHEGSSPASLLRRRRLSEAGGTPKAMERMYTPVSLDADERYREDKHLRDAEDECSIETRDDEPLREVCELDDYDDLSFDQIRWLSTPSDRWVLSPNQFGRILWDLLTLSLVISECVTVPLEICFSLEIAVWWHNLSTALFTLDICISFTTGYFMGGLLIMRRNLIIRKYVKTWFLLDVASTFPWHALTGDSGETGVRNDGGTALLRILKMGKMLRVLRLLRLAKLNSMLQRLKSLSGASGSYRLKLLASMTKMFLVFGMLSHWAACVWGWIGDPLNVGASGEAPNWVTCTMGGACEPGIEGSPWRQRYALENYGVTTQYLVALQYTTGLLTGGGVPVEAGYAFERIFTIVTMISSVLICSTVVGGILLIMNREQETNLRDEERIQRMSEFMSARKVPVTLQAKIRRYVDYRNKLQRDSGTHDRSFISMLSPWLEIELIEHLNRSVLIRHPFFKSLPTQVIREICLEAVSVLFAPDDVVVEKGFVAVSALFIVRGKLRVLSAVGKRSVYLVAPSWVGDKCLFVDTNRTHTVSAVTSSEVLKLQKSNLLQVCTEFPEAQCAYAEFQKKLLNGDDSSLRCAVCGAPGHRQEDCLAAQQANATAGKLNEQDSSQKVPCFSLLDTMCGRSDMHNVLVSNE